MRLVVRGGAHHVERTDQPADPPAGHGVGLRHPVDDDAGVGQLGHDDRHRDVLGGAVDEVLVDLVGDDPDAVLDGPAPDRLDLGRGGDGARRVGGRAPQQDLGTRGARRLELLDAHPVALLLGGDDNDGHATGELDRLGVGRPVRSRQEDLVTRVEQRGERLVDRLLAAVGDQDLGGRHLVAAVPAGLLRDRGPERRHAGGGGVAVVRRVGAGGLRRGDDGSRRGEVRLAGAEADDVLARGLLGLGLGVHGERGRLGDAADAGREASGRGGGSGVGHTAIVPCPVEPVEPGPRGRAVCPARSTPYTLPSGA